MPIRPLALGDLPGVADMWNGAIRASAITFAAEEKTGLGLAAWLVAGPPRLAAASGHRVWPPRLAAVGGRRRAAGICRRGRVSPRPRPCAGVGALRFRRRPGPAWLGPWPRRGRGADRRAGGRGARGRDWQSDGSLIGSLIGAVSGENAGALAFHTRIGVAEVGRIPRAGWKFGRWLDLALLQRPL
jgi:phosphinothricin acetyltransferase